MGIPLEITSIIEHLGIDRKAFEHWAAWNAAVEVAAADVDADTDADAGKPMQRESALGVTPGCTDYR